MVVPTLITKIPPWKGIILWKLEAKQEHLNPSNTTILLSSLQVHLWLQMFPTVLPLISKERCASPSESCSVLCRRLMDRRISARIVQKLPQFVLLHQPCSITFRPFKKIKNTIEDKPAIPKVLLQSESGSSNYRKISSCEESSCVLMLL